MNLLDTVDETSDVFFVNFNQDCSSLAVGCRKGFKLYSLNQVDELEVIHENTTDNIRIIERLFSSSLVALVTVSSPRKLKVCHFRKGSEICNYSYSNTILAVKLNRARLVVCLGESLYIHNIRDMKVLHTIRDTPPNPNGLCVLSVNSETCYLAYPGSNTIGEVQIFDGLNLQAKSMIPAHDNPLAAMAFDPSGTKLATASEKGTVIRVFNVTDGAKLYEFRRGVKRCVSIYSLSFSEDNAFLSASSNTETVHIFRLDDCKDVKPTEEPQSWIGYLGKAFMQSATYLPSQVADMFCQGRSFATVHLPFSGVKNVCSLVMIQKVLRVVVVSREGTVYIYDIDTAEGGDCTLVNAIRINNCDDDCDQSTENPMDAQMNSPIEQNSRRPTLTGGASYAAVVRGNESSSAQDEKSDKGELYQHNTSIPDSKNELKIDDISEFPPMLQQGDYNNSHLVPQRL